MMYWPVLLHVCVHNYIHMHVLTICGSFVKHRRSPAMATSDPVCIIIMQCKDMVEQHVDVDSPTCTCTGHIPHC